MEGPTCTMLPKNIASLLRHNPPQCSCRLKDNCAPVIPMIPIVVVPIVRFSTPRHRRSSWLMIRTPLNAFHRVGGNASLCLDLFLQNLMNIQHSVWCTRGTHIEGTRSDKRTEETSEGLAPPSPCWTTRLLPNSSPHKYADCCRKIAKRMGECCWQRASPSNFATSTSGTRGRKPHSHREDGQLGIHVLQSLQNVTDNLSMFWSKKRVGKATLWFPLIFRSVLRWCARVFFGRNRRSVFSSDSGCFLSNRCTFVSGQTCTQLVRTQCRALTATLGVKKVCRHGRRTLAKNM